MYLLFLVAPPILLLLLVWQLVDWEGARTMTARLAYQWLAASAITTLIWGYVPVASPKGVYETWIWVGGWVYLAIAVVATPLCIFLIRRNSRNGIFIPKGTPGAPTFWGTVGNALNALDGGAESK
jgi:hypothetical protein